MSQEAINKNIESLKKAVEGMTLISKELEASDHFVTNTDYDYSRLVVSLPKFLLKFSSEANKWIAEHQCVCSCNCHKKTELTEAERITLNQKLIDAARDNNIEGAREALKNGADVNAKDKAGKTALIWAARYGHTEVVKMLIAAGADVNAKNSDGNTALIWAAYYGHAEIIKMLIAAGADVNATDNGGNTALIWAAREGHTEIAKLLWIE